jgi:hypothetical protein
MMWQQLLQWLLLYLQALERVCLSARWFNITENQDAGITKQHFMTVTI